MILLYFTLKGSVNTVNTKLDTSVKDIENKNLSLNTQFNQYKASMSGNVNVTGMVCFKYNNTNYCLSGKDILRLNSMYPNNAPYVNVVNRRVIPIGDNQDNFVKIVSMNSTSDGYRLLTPYSYTWGPFRGEYDIPPPAKNAKRKWRFYAVYNDNTTQGSLVIRMNIEKSWQSAGRFDMDFYLPSTCGGDAGARGGYSQILEVPPQPDPWHAYLYGFIKPGTVLCGSDKMEGSMFKIYHLELQALDVYE